MARLSVTELEGLLDCAQGAVSRIESHLRERRAAERTCTICLSSAKSVAFVPCGHMACSECAAPGQLAQCHICRAPITQRLQVYS